MQEVVPSPDVNSSIGFYTSLEKPDDPSLAIRKQKIKYREVLKPYLSISIQKEVVGLQLKIRSWQISSHGEGISCIDDTIQEDVWSSGEAQNWKEWDEFFPWATFQKTFNEMRTSLPNLNMKILMWNVRGAKSSDYLSHAWKVLCTYKLVVFIFVETKSDEDRANRVSRVLGFDNYKSVAALGKRGGMWLFRQNDFEMMYYTKGTPN